MVMVLFLFLFLFLLLLLFLFLFLLLLLLLLLLVLLLHLHLHLRLLLLIAINNSDSEMSTLRHMCYCVRGLLQVWLAIVVGCGRLWLVNLVGDFDDLSPAYLALMVPTILGWLLAMVVSGIIMILGYFFWAT